MNNIIICIGKLCVVPIVSHVLKKKKIVNRLTSYAAGV